MKHWLLEKFKLVGERSSISDRSGDYNYNELIYKIEQLTKNFDSIPAGSVVSICSDYSFRAIAAFIALALKKCILVPITIQNKEEIQVRVQESFSNFIITPDSDKWIITRVETTGNHDFLRQLQSTDRAGLVLFSSGSTGKPKAMIHDLDTLLDFYQDRRQKPVVFLIFLMFDHIGGINTLFNALSMGGHLILPENRDAEHVCRLVEKYKVKILPASPSFLNLLLISEAHTRYNLKSLRMITYGTEGMPESLLSKIKQVFPKVRLLQTFGTSETGIARTSSKASDSTFFKIDDPDVEYKIVDGELWLKSGTQVLGYLNVDNNAFDEQGWFRTGDLVEQVDDNYMRIIGRNKEIINVGGEKVLPAEVENVLIQIPEIADCMVYGQSNAITGHHVAADVVLNQEMSRKNAKKLIRKFCQSHLEQYKIPAKIYFIEKIELGSNLKKIRRK
jgi:acyl-coenzyme A synthetase/AMP-(fatty) acid ligase